MNEITDVEGVLRDYISQVLHLSLGTAADGKPWVCEVHFAYDDELNLYFLSKPATRHCQEIAANPNVAGNIIVQHGPMDIPRGVYFEGTAEQIPRVEETDTAFVVYDERLKRGEWILRDRDVEEGARMYKISVTDWYLFDARESKPAQKYHLAWPKA